MATTYRANVAQSLGLSADAPEEDIVRAFRRSLNPDEPTDKDKTASEDPRERMTDLALSEQDKAAASGHQISFTEALTRARRANPKLDAVLSEGYAAGRWTR